MKNKNNYAAGLFDGEGSITLTKKRKSDKFRTVCVSMSSTSYELLQFMIDNFGGNIVKKKKYKDHHKQAWSWKLERLKAVNFIRKIYPYMIEKKKRGRSLLVLNNYEKVTTKGGRYTNEMHSKKVAFEDEFFKI